MSVDDRAADLFRAWGIRDEATLPDDVEVEQRDAVLWLAFVVGTAVVTMLAFGRIVDILVDGPVGLLQFVVIVAVVGVIVRSIVRVAATVADYALGLERLVATGDAVEDEQAHLAADDCYHALTEQGWPIDEVEPVATTDADEVARLRIRSTDTVPIDRFDDGDEGS